MDWWKTKAIDAPSSIPSTWNRPQQMRIEERTPISLRAMQNIRQEVAKCLAELRVAQAPLSSPVWLPQRLDPVTRSSLPPILNPTAGAGRFHRSPILPDAPPGNVLQVVNNYTTIRGVAPDLPAISSRSKELEFMRPPHTLNLGTANTQSYCENHKDGPKRRASSVFIPKIPCNVAAVIRRWIMSSAGEGIQKALVYFSEKERNKHGDPHKKLFSKRKPAAIAFLLFISQKSVEEYESAFGSIRKTMEVLKIYKKSAEFLRDAQKRGEYNPKMSDKELQQFTESIAKSCEPYL